MSDFGQNLNILQMDSQNKTFQQEQALDYIVSAIHRKKKKNQESKDNVSLQKLYETMTNVVSGLDQSINHCKKYNQAKIHRKYQIILNDQRKRIELLEQKVREEHKARSPSKKYIEDLLDKLINFKFQNQSLTKRNSELSQQNMQLKEKLRIYEEHLPKNDNKEQNKQSVEIGGEISGPSIKNEVISYLKLKQQLRKHQTQQKSKFERFLKKVKDSIQNWSMRQFLQSIDKWSVQCLANSSYLLDSFEQLPKNQFMKGIPNRIPNNITHNGEINILNKSLNAKNHVIRSRKTYSYKQFMGSPNGQNNILR